VQAPAASQDIPRNPKRISNGIALDNARYGLLLVWIESVQSLRVTRIDERSDLLAKGVVVIGA
jgi:hypothetical protein